MAVKPFFDFINEYNLSLENYSKYYYLVLRMNDDTLKNLYSGKLNGLKGISSSTNIINAFFDVRDILLVMDKNEVEKINNLKKVEYGDIEELSKNNFKLLKRLYQVDDDYSTESLLYQGFRKLSHGKNYIKLRKHVNKNLYNLYKALDHNCHKMGIFKNDTYEDFIDKAYNNLENTLDFKFTKEDMELIFRLVILNFADLFKHEEEHLVLNKSFIIPKNSFLFIKGQNPNSCLFEEVNSLLKIHLDKLKENFYVKILPYKKSYSIISDTHKQVFIYLRYLDKLKQRAI